MRLLIKVEIRILARLPDHLQNELQQSKGIISKLPNVTRNLGSLLSLTFISSFRIEVLFIPMKLHIFSELS